MCGIVGLFLKDQALRPELGRLFAPMLVEMTSRGPDSAGIAVFRNPSPSDFCKLTAFNPKTDFNWKRAAKMLQAELGSEVASSPNDTHCVLLCAADADHASAALEALDEDMQVMSVGNFVEIYKETGLPDDVVSRFGVGQMEGSHAVGHTRMATESAVTTAGSHPFSTGMDLCLVHNGSLSNHNRLRDRLKRAGLKFRTENDTEVAAAYLTHRMQSGCSLHQALDDCINDLDGFYTFVAGSADGFAVLRDPIACKPAVLAETDRFVAFGSEYRSLAILPGIEDAKVWEPEPAVVYSWSIH